MIKFIFIVGILMGVNLTHSSYRQQLEEREAWQKSISMVRSLLDQELQIADWEDQQHWMPPAYLQREEERERLAQDWLMHPDYERDPAGYAGMANFCRTSVSNEEKMQGKPQAVAYLLTKYPPKEGGLYPYYKKEVDKILTIYSCRRNFKQEWTPWNEIGIQAQGKSYPLYAIPELIALIEIRKLPVFTAIGQKYLDKVKQQLEEKQKEQALADQLQQVL